MAFGQVYSKSPVNESFLREFIKIGVSEKLNKTEGFVIS